MRAMTKMLSRLRDFSRRYPVKNSRAAVRPSMSSGNARPTPIQLFS
jgi:hypothetical protein